MIPYPAPRRLVLPEVQLRKSRRLPVRGEVLVQLGEAVRPPDVVACARRPANPVVVPVGQILGVPPTDVTRLLKRWAGEAVAKDEVLAEKKGLLGVGRRICRSPIDGMVLSGPHGEGEVVLTPPDEEIALLAGISGRVTGVIPERGVVVETPASYVQGAGGYGTEGQGILRIASEPGGEIKADGIDAGLAGAVLVGGHIGRAALEQAINAGVTGIVAAGISGEDYAWLAGSGAAITLVITEGAGVQTMPAATFELFERRAGMATLLKGAPDADGGTDVVVSLSGAGKIARLPEVEFRAGAAVLIASGRQIGQRGRIAALPAVPQWLASGIVAHVAVVTLNDGPTVTVACDNLLLCA